MRLWCAPAGRKAIIAQASSPTEQKYRRLCTPAPLKTVRVRGVDGARWSQQPELRALKRAKWSGAGGPTKIIDLYQCTCPGNSRCSLHPLNTHTHAFIQFFIYPSIHPSIHSFTHQGQPDVVPGRLSKHQSVPGRRAVRPGAREWDEYGVKTRVDLG